MKGFLTIAAFALLFNVQVSASDLKTNLSGPTSTQALQQLLAGNQRFVTNQSQHLHQDFKSVLATKDEQHPFAVVLTCADSRVDPSILFDEGIGDIFVIRVAGNIIDDAVLGSIEYAVAHLGAPLVMVLGHSKCGAVKASFSYQEKDHIQSIVEEIKHVHPQITSKTMEGKIEQCTLFNIRRAVEKINTSSPKLAGFLKQGKFETVGAVYQVETGKVEILPNLGLASQH